jgi:DHA3 family tetracycline resistance protein-like MFS transporter
VGFTFLSGAQQAWIADEVGVEAVGPVYMRSAQVDQLCRIVAIPISIALATQDLNLPIVLGGGAFVGLSAIMLLVMPERGFTRPERQNRGVSFTDMTEKFRASAQLVKRTPILITVFGIAAFYGMAGEGFDRLWVKHFFDNLGFPGRWDLEPVIWFGVIRMGSALLSIVAVEIVRKRINTTSHRMVSRGLFSINLLQIGTLFFFASAEGFIAGMIAFWLAVSLSRMYDPLYLAWINQNIDSQVRATVISMSSQADAIGQIAGGPMLGAVGTLSSLRAALYGAGIILTPALLLYTRAFGQGRSEPEARTAGDPA